MRYDEFLLAFDSVKVMYVQYRYLVVPAPYPVNISSRATPASGRTLDATKKHAGQFRNVVVPKSQTAHTNKICAPESCNI
jgi:hypothetical protein